jgi:hypothetical protein
MPRPRTFDREHVAAILTEALELGLPTIATVMDIFGVTVDRAKYMIRVVKDDGLLGVKGHQAVVATFTRGASSGSNRILLCETCRSAWPCAMARPGSPPVTRGRKGRLRNDAQRPGAHPGRQRTSPR